ncbi:MAG: hypothetical protein ACLFQV_00695 [Vulcanimicrobiota bacterium]
MADNTNELKQIVAPLEEKKMWAGLCYPLWFGFSPWIIYSNKKEDLFLYFNALQGMYYGSITFSATLISSIFIFLILFYRSDSSELTSSPITRTLGLGTVTIAILAVFLLLVFVTFVINLWYGYKASTGKFVKLPIIGSLALQQVNEYHHQLISDYEAVLDKESSEEPIREVETEMGKVEQPPPAALSPAEQLVASMGGEPGGQSYFKSGYENEEEDQEEQSLSEYQRLLQVKPPVEEIQSLFSVPEEKEPEESLNAADQIYQNFYNQPQVENTTETGPVIEDEPEDTGYYEDVEEEPPVHITPVKASIFEIQRRKKMEKEKPAEEYRRLQRESRPVEHCEENIREINRLKKESDTEAQRIKKIDLLRRKDSPEGRMSSLERLQLLNKKVDSKQKQLEKQAEKSFSSQKKPEQGRSTSFLGEPPSGAKKEENEFKELPLKKFVTRKEEPKKEEPQSTQFLPQSPETRFMPPEEHYQFMQKSYRKYNMLPQKTSKKDREKKLKSTRDTGFLTPETQEQLNKRYRKISLTGNKKETNKKKERPLPKAPETGFLSSSPLAKKPQKKKEPQIRKIDLSKAWKQIVSVEETDEKKEKKPVSRSTSFLSPETLKKSQTEDKTESDNKFETKIIRAQKRINEKEQPAEETEESSRIRQAKQRKERLELLKQKYQELQGKTGELSIPKAPSSLKKTTPIKTTRGTNFLNPQEQFELLQKKYQEISSTQQPDSLSRKKPARNQAGTPPAPDMGPKKIDVSKLSREERRKRLRAVMKKVDYKSKDNQ